MSKAWMIAAIALLACDDGDRSKDVRSASHEEDAALDGGMAPPQPGPPEDASPQDARREPLDATHDSSVDAGRAPQTADAAIGKPAVTDAELPDATSRYDAAVHGDASTSDATLPPTARALRSFVYVGGWDWSGSSYPFRTFELDRTSGEMAALGQPLDAGANPSYVASSSDGRFLYIANEYQGKAGVTVAAVDLTTGIPRVVDHERLDGEGSFVFTSIDPSGKFVLAANINAGKVFVYPIEANGTLAAAVDVESFDPKAETHSVRVHPSGRWAFAPNKAANQIAQLHFDGASGQLSANTPAALASTHRGPRHIAFTPSGAFAYVTYEADSLVAAYRVEANGTLSELEAESTLPASYTGANTGAHVLVHPNGRFLYCSNRGHDSIVVFAIAADGRLSLLQHAPTRGKTPRNFDIDEDGQRLVVANQGDENAQNGSLAAFTIGDDGRLTALGTPLGGLRVPNAVSIVTTTKP